MGLLDRIARHRVRRPAGQRGIAFTVAIFLATLAFPQGPRLEVAKLAVLLGSAISGVLGFAILFLRHRARRQR